ncbi:uncharacterized protein LOC130758950 isoform X1 [Actinidia eriantha]|uniref:uncharacterized protein LOC130758950 isoform X1 n=1 Tax=Actinidia eriantha TaxID=165200 RepID=UPI0025844234|nr:uncharacterized protein LOC130758950 isoform X1 [Actinidia eriantha]
MGLKPPLLKRLYYLLVHLSSNPPICYPRAGADSTFWDLKIGRFGVRVPFGDISSLSDALFRELSQTFKQFLSALHGITASRDIGQASLHFDIEASAEQLNLLLRCCMVMLNLLVTDQYCLLRNGQILLDIQGELCSLNLVQGNEENTISIEKVSREFTYKGSDCATSLSLTEDIVASLHFLEPVDPCLPFLCSLLEVLLPVESYLCATPAMVILEIEDFRVPELSLTASLVLLLNPLMISAPKFLHAHLISLVSETITIGMGLENMRPDVRLMDRYLSALESMPSLSRDCMGRENGQVQTSNSLIPNNMLRVVGLEEETEEASDGKIFLKCMLENRGEPFDFDDLAAFIECKRGKDYSGWLKDRQRYRKWKCAKMAVLRWKKKKKTWKFMKGKKT